MHGRKYLRILVEFRSTFSSEQIEGQGKLIDLSLWGCRIDSDILIPAGIALALRVYVPDVDSPIQIDTARVRWVQGRACGVEFIRLSAKDLQRIRHLVQDPEREN